MTRLNVMQPWLGEAEVSALSQVIASGWIAQGPQVAAFERAFATMQEAHDAVAVSSCTAACSAPKHGRWFRRRSSASSVASIPLT